MKNIAIIPARGGSKRIPRKNIKEFMGKPIIAYSIEAAISSDLFDEVMVSTDDQEIANIALEYGASVPFLRSDKNSDDHATTVSVLKEVISNYHKSGTNYDNLCCIYPAAPLILKIKLQESYNLLTSGNADSVISVVKYNHPIQRSFIINKQGQLRYNWPENSLKRSQDIDESYHDAGQFYWCRVSAMLKENSLITENSFAYVQSELDVQDIDNDEDFDIAKLKYLILNDHSDKTLDLPGADSVQPFLKI